MVFECSICKEPCQSDGICATIPCGHVYHNRCLNTWKDVGNGTCPVCRKSFKKTIELYGVNPNCNEDNEGSPTDLRDEHTQLQVSLNEVRQELQKVQSSYYQILEDYSAERNACYLLEREIALKEKNEAEFQKRLNEIKLKLTTSSSNNFWMRFRTLFEYWNA